MANTTRRVHITPDDMKVGGLRWLDSKFTFTLTEYRHPKANIEVVMHLDVWWIKYIASHIYTVIDHVQGQVNDTKRAMRGDT